MEATNTHKQGLTNRKKSSLKTEDAVSMLEKGIGLNKICYNEGISQHRLRQMLIEKLGIIEYDALIFHSRRIRQQKYKHKKERKYLKSEKNSADEAGVASPKGRTVSSFLGVGLP